MPNTETLKNKYEAVFIFSLKSSEEEIAEQVAKFKALIEENAELDLVDEWGKRRLAYTIDYQDEGFYVLFKFTSDASFPAELSRRSNISENVLRSMCIRIEE